MKILAHGRAQQGWAGEFKCTGAGNGNGGCGAKLLVEEDDLYITTSSAMGEVDHHTTFRCCACSVETDVDVPPTVPRKGDRNRTTPKRVVRDSMLNAIRLAQWDLVSDLAREYAPEFFAEQDDE